MILTKNKSRLVPIVYQRRDRFKFVLDAGIELSKIKKTFFTFTFPK